MAFVATILIVAVVVTILTVARGFVLTYLWKWFITPLGLPELSISHAIGISLIVGFLTYENAKKENEGFEALGAGVVSLILVFGVGWVIHQVMIG